MVAKGVLRKLRFRELLYNYKSFISIILIATLCVALFTGLYANYRNFAIKVDIFYNKTNMPDYFVTLTKYDSSDLDFISNIDGVEQAEVRAYLPIQYQTKTVTIIVCDDDSKLSVPIDGYDDGVLVTQNFLNTFNYKVGDSVKVSLPIEQQFTIPSNMVNVGESDYLSNGEIQMSFTITGVMKHPENIENNSIYSGLIYLNSSNFIQAIKDQFSLTYNSIFNNLFSEQINDICQIDNFINQIIIKSNIDVKDEINNYYVDKPSSNLLSLLSRDSFPTNSSIEMDVVQAKQLLFVFPIVFYLVGVLVIITSVKELIHKETKNIGILSQLGFSKVEIITHYSLIAVLLVTIGAILGVILGPSIIPNIMGAKYEILYNLEPCKLPIFYMPYLFCFLIIILVAVFASIIISYQVVNQMPAIILRNEDKIRLKKSNFKARKNLLTLKMSLRSMRINKVRSFMVLIGVMGCSALLVCGFGINDTLNYSVDKELNELIAYDLQVTYDNDLDIQSDKIENVDLYENHSIIALNSDKSYNTSLYIFKSNRQIFKPYIPSDGCMISKRLSRDLGLNIGDSITYIYNNQSFSIKINSIEEFSFTSGIFIEDTTTNFKPNGCYITLKNKDDIDSFKNDLLSKGATSVITNEELATTADNILSGIRAITITVQIFAILLALAVIYNLAQLNFKERIRDIATLKVLGFGKIEIAQILLYEITLLTLFGCIFGMLLGKPLLVLLLEINQTSRFTYIYHVDLVSYLIAIILTLIISVIINLIMTKLSDKIQMVESLKSVE